MATNHQARRKPVIAPCVYCGHLARKAAGPGPATCASHRDLLALDPYYTDVGRGETVTRYAPKTAEGVSELRVDSPTIDRYADRPRVQPA